MPRRRSDRLLVWSPNDDDSDSDNGRDVPGEASLVQQPNPSDDSIDNASSVNDQLNESDIYRDGPADGEASDDSSDDNASSVNDQLNESDIYRDGPADGEASDDNSDDNASSVNDQPNESDSNHFTRKTITVYSDSDFGSNDSVDEHADIIMHDVSGTYSIQHPEKYVQYSDMDSNSSEFEALLFDQDAMNADDREEQVPYALYIADLSDDDDDDVEVDDGIYNEHETQPDDGPLLGSDSASEPSDIEIIQHRVSDEPIPPFHLAFGLWCEQSSISRSDYRYLREVLQMGNSMNMLRIDDTMLLPRKLDTLKRLVRTRLPMLRMLRRLINVVIEKQPTLPSGQKSEQRIRITRQTWHYWFDPSDLVTNILNAHVLVKAMYFGMARYVDYPEEFWESPAWGSSALTTSGQFAHTRGGSIIIPGDIVRLTEPVEGFTKGRVLFVGLDYRSTAHIEGEVVLTLQPVVTATKLEVPESMRIQERELVLLDTTFEVVPELIVCQLDVVMQWDFTYDKGAQDDIAEPFPNLNPKFFIRYIIDPSSQEYKSIRYMHPTRGDLEVRHYGRELLERFTQTDVPCMSLPFILFVDDFGVHRNMYRALKGFYITPACLPYHERRKPGNEFTLTLGPHGASMTDIVTNLEPGLVALAHGKTLRINGAEVMVKAFPIVLTGDMPQAADNSGFMRHNAERGCRACKCTSHERADLDYDVVANGRYHFDTIFLRKKGDTIHGRQTRSRFFRKLGMREEAPAIAKISPALDLILGRGYDAPHSEWRGIGRVIIGFLFNEILTKTGQIKFTKALQQIPFPANWPRIQSPFHLFSWSLSETGRVLVLIPLILRCYSKPIWFKMPFIQYLASMPRSNLIPLHTLILCFQAIQVSITHTRSKSLLPLTADKISRVVRGGRAAYKLLIEFKALNAMPPDEPVDDSVEGFDNDRVEPFSSQDNDKTEYFPVPSLNPDPDLDLDTEPGLYLSSDTGSADIDSDLSVCIDTAKPIRMTKWQKLLALPNVHVGLHLADNVREYGHVMNCNVLNGELSHAKWKAWADAAAPSNLMAYLFAKENVRQSLRLGLAGSWEEAFPELEEPLHMIQEHCPRLVRSFVPLNERSMEMDDNESDDISVEGFTNVNVSIKSFCIGEDLAHLLKLRRVMNIHTLPRNEVFGRLIRSAFQIYGMRNVVQFSWYDRVQWFQRISFTSNSDQRRWTLNVGDFTRTRDHQNDYDDDTSLCRIEQIAIIYFQRRKYIFMIGLKAQDTSMKDQCLRDIHVYSVMEKVNDIVVFGLLAVTGQKEYMLPAPDDGPWMDEEDEAGKAFFMHCEWNMDFQ
ncbi:hypothetical protein BP6252_02202 [Coleophoma cylindrospora]|uniref:Uncharacterized protein n=1 Tax=Coleophoma cylindrospora TaxID=1849047 RepID=A0A3D8SE72_9HELO|nr:hypothetical protein BP6252_02202 [Coleophoma cylindrospora]